VPYTGHRPTQCFGNWLCPSSGWNRNIFSWAHFMNVIFQHPVALCRSDLVVAAPSLCNVARCSFIRHDFITCFGLNVHLQAYILLYFRTLCSQKCGFPSPVVIASCYFGYVGSTSLFFCNVRCTYKAQKPLSQTILWSQLICISTPSNGLN
jgi:hypothetical protein